MPKHYERVSAVERVGRTNMECLDLQVNGYQGVDFNGDEVLAEELHAACEQLKADGVAGILATIITARIDRMTARLSRLARLRREDDLVRERIWGFHVEGPFLNATPGYVGAHPAAHVLPASLDAMKRLLESGEGLVRLVTRAGAGRRSGSDTFSGRSGDYRFRRSLRSQPRPTGCGAGRRTFHVHAPWAMVAR